MDGSPVTGGFIARTGPPAGHFPGSSQNTRHQNTRQKGRSAVSVPGASLVVQNPVYPSKSHDKVDLADRHLQINFVAPDHLPLEDLVPTPRVRLSLKEDPWLNWVGSKPGTIEALAYVGELDAAAWIKAQLQERQRIETAKGEFVFQPLLTTLENMQVLIRHIQDGLQFPEPLTEEEAAALARLEAQTTALATAKTPYYKRSVGLALSLMVLCEIITQRQILQPLVAGLPRAQRRRIQSARLPEDPAERAATLPALPWTPLAPGRGGWAGDLDWLGACSVRRVFYQTLNDGNCLVYPSFHPLTLGHFCRFAHLPLYPIGLSADYACSADGAMMSPLAFAAHDIDHMADLADVGAPAPWITTPVEGLMCRHAKRLQLCQLLLDSRPDIRRRFHLDPALQLLMFELVHEKSPWLVGSDLDDYDSPFLFFIRTLFKARRDDWESYTADDRQGTDTQAALAALWASCLWQHWQNEATSVTPELLHKLAHHFIHQGVPQLEAHLDFLERHRGTLRQLFIRTGSCRVLDNNIRFFTSGLWPQRLSLIIFEHRQEASGLCHLDNTDRLYLTALHSPLLRQLIKTATGEDLPPGTADAAPLEQNGAMDMES